MAKIEKTLCENFDRVLEAVEDGILRGSISATLEESGDWQEGSVRCALRVFERYSWIGGNRLSLSVTLFGKDGNVHVCGITAGGSQAVFIKINTFGEASFLDRLQDILDAL